MAFQERDGALRYAFKLRARGLGVPGPTRVAMTVREEHEVLRTSATHGKLAAAWTLNTYSSLSYVSNGVFIGDGAYNS